MKSFFYSVHFSQDGFQKIYDDIAREVNLPDWAKRVHHFVYSIMEAYSDKVLLLVDSSREAIAEKNWQVGEIASDLFMDYGVMVSPIVENRKYYQDRIDLLPFFGNIDREGVKLSA